MLPYLPGGDVLAIATDDDHSVKCTTDLTVVGMQEGEQVLHGRRFVECNTFVATHPGCWQCSVCAVCVRQE